MPASFPWEPIGWTGGYKAAIQHTPHAGKAFPRPLAEAFASGFNELTPSALVLSQSKPGLANPTTPIAPPFPTHRQPGQWQE